MRVSLDGGYFVASLRTDGLLREPACDFVRAPHFFVFH